MGQTNFTDVVVDDAEELAAGRGQLTTQLTAIKADLDAFATLTTELRVDHETVNLGGDSCR